MLCFGFVIGTAPSSSSGDTHRSAASSHAHHRGRDTSATFSEAEGNALKMLGAGAHINLAPATAPPTAAPAALVNQPPLASRENFAFAPYWTLAQSSNFSITGLSTIAYFSIDVNANGTLDESGSGWNGFQSQDLANLITRAHAAGERVVLTVTDFDQGSLNALTSSPTAAGTLSSTLIPLLQAKSLDGINFDFEGNGSSDQGGLTNLVTSVSGAFRAADPHWQITMDTYASSAGDSGGFYNIPALRPGGRRLLRHGLRAEPSGHPDSRLAAHQRPVQQPDHAPAVHGRRAGVQGDSRRALLRHRLADEQWDHGGRGRGRRQRHPRLASRGQRPAVLGPGH